MSHWELSTKLFDSLNTFTSYVSQCWSLPKVYHRMLLWLRLRTATVYEKKHEYSHGSLIICPFRNISMVAVSTGSLISLGLDSWPDLQYQEYSPSCGASLWSCDKEVVYKPIQHSCHSFTRWSSEPGSSVLQYSEQSWVRALILFLSKCPA